MTVAAVHPKSHENPLEISHGFHFEENTLDKLPLGEVVEGVKTRWTNFPLMKW